MALSTATGIIYQLLPEPHAGLLAGILFGVKTALDKDLMESLRNSGTLHIIALSGMNISILINLVHLFFLRIVSRRVSSLFTIVVIIGFVYFVGFSPSIVRAAIMGVFGLTAIIFGKQVWSLFSLVLAVALMILLNPPWVYELSFQLSVLATAGIILFYQSKREEKPEAKMEVWSLRTAFYSLKSWLADELALSLSAQVLTIPLLVIVFHKISIVSPLATLFITPLLPSLTVLGFATVFLGWIWVPLGLPFAWACWIFLSYILFIVRTFGSLPISTVGW